MMPATLVRASPPYLSIHLVKSVGMEETEDIFYCLELMMPATSVSTACYTSEGKKPTAIHLEEPDEPDLAMPFQGTGALRLALSLDW